MHKHSWRCVAHVYMELVPSFVCHLESGCLGYYRVLAIAAGGRLAHDLVLGRGHPVEPRRLPLVTSRLRLQRIRQGAC